MVLMTYNIVNVLVNHFQRYIQKWLRQCIFILSCVWVWLFWLVDASWSKALGSSHHGVLKAEFWRRVCHVLLQFSVIWVLHTLRSVWTLVPGLSAVCSFSVFVSNIRNKRLFECKYHRLKLLTEQSPEACPQGGLEPQKHNFAQQPK